MGFDKAKAVRAAEKHLGQGKIPAAIQEYRKIVEQDKSDFTALNMLGDLYARVDKKDEAIKCFTGLAEHYRDQGFALKAIAMYKKISRLNPDASDVAGKLAALYEQQGLFAEARAQYLTVAETHSRAGQTREALSVLQRIADLDPRNTEIRLRLAESYLREKLMAEAAKTFTEAGQQFLARSDYQNALAAYTRAHDLNPQDYAVLSGLTQAYCALGTATEAAAALERAVAEQPADRELLSMLVNVYLEAEDAQAAERITDDLVKLDPPSYARSLDVARLYLKQDKAEQTTRVLTQIIEPALAGREEDALVNLLNETLAHDPQKLDALQMLVRIHTWQRDDDKLRTVLEQLAEAARRATLEADERDALTQLVRLVPDEPSYRERLSAVGGALDSFDVMEDTLAPSEEVPTFENFVLTDEAHTARDSEAAGPEALVGKGSDFEWNSVAPEASDFAPSPAASFADLNAEFADVAAPLHLSTVQAAAPDEQEGFQEVDFNFSIETPSVEKPSAATEGAGGQTPPADARLEALLAQELESVDFYIAQGYQDIARDTLEILEKQYGAHQGIEARRGQLGLTATPPPTSFAEAEPVATETSSFSDFAQYEITTPEAIPAEADETEADEIEVDAVFAELAATAPASSNTAINSPPVIAQPTIDAGLAAVFDEFRAAVEEEDPLPTADYETHYNLGLAYKEMDLMDDAIEEFQAAASIVAPQDGTSRYLQCCNLLGHCFMSKGMGRLAAMWFQRGLDAPGHTEDEYQALRFELGTAYEQMGDLDHALDMFTEVYGIDVSYRGVANKLRELQAQKR
ncbi:MAG: tetratricopeptide repeat protein [Pyrinomonadaceae bacterium]|nr:tetratricopeptide repeat protein [Pyrinomonadaceae bacterium]